MKKRWINNMHGKLKVLLSLIFEREFKLAFFSGLCGFASRVGLWRVYKIFSKNRYDICCDYLERNVINNSVTDQEMKTDSYVTRVVEENSIIWTMWYQGYDSAPEIVKKAIESIRNHSNGHEVVIIDKDNVWEYVDLPHYIVTKFQNGIISYAHFSDIVRVELLEKYGGIWIDSTVFVVENIPKDLFTYDFWSIHWPSD